MTIKRFESATEQSRILEEIASSFPKDSPQYIAIENAAYAFLFAISEQYEAFVKFIEEDNKELSEEQKENLRKMGISVK